ncbi:hypothetical protein K1719_004050 [Acacia pycnantha]|nr:hypothetical protein K1719_004050 [Acacia pycnantha]
MSQVKASFRSEQRNRGATFLLLRRRLSSGLRPQRLPCSGVPLVSGCSGGPPLSLAVGVFVSTSLSASSSSMASGSPVASCSLMASSSTVVSGRGDASSFLLFLLLYNHLQLPSPPNERHGVRKIQSSVYQVPDRVDVKWSVPPSGYVRVDVDESVNNHKVAACDGIVGDSTGAWMIGFQQNIGFYYIIATELQAIKADIQVCRELGSTKIQLHSDSTEAICLLTL